jgi:thymidylate kinase
MDFETIYELHKDILRPDITLFIDISLETMIDRLGTRGGHAELYEQEDFLQKCHAGYQNAIRFLQSKGENIIIIDGEGSVAEVAARIQQKIGVL